MKPITKPLSRCVIMHFGHWQKVPEFRWSTQLTKTRCVIHRQALVRLRPTRCNVLPCARTDMLLSRVRLLWPCPSNKPDAPFIQVAHAKSSTCPPPRRASTATPRSTSLRLTYVYSSLSILCFHSFICIHRSSQVKNLSVLLFIPKPAINSLLSVLLLFWLR